MKYRLTLMVIVGIAIGAVIITAMTKADLIASISAKIGFDADGDGVVKEYYDCKLAEIPSDRSEVIVDERTGKKIPGFVRFENLFLQFPPGKIPPEITEWHEIIVRGEASPRNGSLIILNDAGEEQAYFNLFEVWPSALRGLKQIRVGFRGSVVDEVELVVGTCTLVRAEDPSDKRRTDRTR